MYITFRIENQDRIERAGPIHILFRLIARKFEWNNTEKSLFLVHSEPFFCCQFDGEGTLRK